MSEEEIREDEREAKAGGEEISEGEEMDDVHDG